MCGIYLTNIQIHKDLVKKKLDLISHRGPDDQNIIKVDDLTFGHVRLSILDLDQRSSQPMSYFDKTIVYNGEIYNYKDVRDKLLPQLQRKEDDKLARQYLLRETEPIDLNGRL